MAEQVERGHALGRQSDRDHFGAQPGGPMPLRQEGFALHMGLAVPGIGDPALDGLQFPAAVADLARWRRWPCCATGPSVSNFVDADVLQPAVFARAHRR